MHLPNIWSDYLNNYLDVQRMKVRVETAVLAIKRSRVEFEAIAFRGMSGALTAIPLAMALDKSLIMVRKADGAHSAYRVEGDKAAKRYLIVDDFVDSGATVRTIVKHIKEFFSDAECVGVFTMSAIDPFSPVVPLTSDPRFQEAT